MTGSADLLSGPARGVVSAMAMTSIRVITTELGFVEETPPEAMSRQRARRRSGRPRAR